MQNDIKKTLHQAVIAAACQCFNHDDVPKIAAQLPLEKPKDAQHGDLASSLALRLAKTLQDSPLNIAKKITAQLLKSLPAHVLKVEVLAPGFINFYLTPNAKFAVIERILKEADDFGKGSHKNQQLLVEYVSANPTGPLHVGHGRGAAYGASLVNVLRYAGFSVTAEYYVNDAGRQMDILAVSAWLRYLESDAPLPWYPSNAYQGDYVRDMAMALKNNHGNLFTRPIDAAFANTHWPKELNSDDPKIIAAHKEQQEKNLDILIFNAKQLLNEHYDTVHQFVLDEQLQDCRSSLEEMGVFHDVWYSEQTLSDKALVQQAFDLMSQQGCIYQQDGAQWFRATDFGDEKDRVMQRSDGSWTYFAADVAYHYDKIKRGFSHLINVFGADHHGYVPRIKGALQALGANPNMLEVILVQFAILYRNNEKVSMSTRAGTYVTLRDLCQEVGMDATRFFYVQRKSDQHMDFDLSLAKENSQNNPVFYVQYAHARIASLLRQNQESAHALSEEMMQLPLLVQFDKFNTSGVAVIDQLNAFPELIETAAAERAPHLLAFYAKDLAANFHSWYNDTKILTSDSQLRQQYLQLAKATQIVLANALKLLGVSAPERM